MSDAVSVVLDTADTQWLAAADSCLSPDEEMRAARFRRPADRDTWRAGRALVRHHLSNTLGLAPADIRFAIDARGRPHVVGVPPGFDCNWSHSGAALALAFSRHHQVGIDVEHLRPDFPVHEVAPTVCTPAERNALAAAPDAHTRHILFFQLWTAKEALMKATGLGVELAPEGIEVDLEHGTPVRYASHPEWHLVCRSASPQLALSWAWRNLPATTSH